MNPMKSMESMESMNIYGNEWKSVPINEIDEINENALVA